MAKVDSIGRLGCGGGFGEGPVPDHCPQNRRAARSTTQPGRLCSNFSLRPVPLLMKGLAVDEIADVVLEGEVAGGRH